MIDKLQNLEIQMWLEKQRLASLGKLPPQKSPRDAYRQLLADLGCLLIRAGRRLQRPALGGRRLPCA
jgi:hypothetical protein